MCRSVLVVCSAFETISRLASRRTPRCVDCVVAELLCLQLPTEAGGLALPQLQAALAGAARLQAALAGGSTPPALPQLLVYAGGETDEVAAAATVQQAAAATAAVAQPRGHGGMPGVQFVGGGGGALVAELRGRAMRGALEADAEALLREAVAGVGLALALGCGGGRRRLLEERLAAMVSDEEVERRHWFERSLAVASKRRN
eukprot:SAG11_NODE_5321_length_1596_cov_1.196393_1_plen_202_part_00